MVSTPFIGAFLSDTDMAQKFGRHDDKAFLCLDRGNDKRRQGRIWWLHGLELLDYWRVGWLVGAWYKHIAST